MKDSMLSRIDWLSLLLYLFLVGFGLVNIYSATYFEEAQNLMSLSTPFGKQLFFMALSFLGGGFLLALRVKFFEQFSIPIYISAVFLLVGLFFFGKTISGARSWYAFGGFGLQPAEFAKMATALILAKVISQFQTNLKKHSIPSQASRYYQSSCLSYCFAT